VATFDTGYPILINFRQVRMKRLRMPYDANEWHILRNKASTDPYGLLYAMLANYGQEYQV